jgi:large subunit ribosomal protein L29
MKATDLREKSVEDLRELQASLAHDVFQNRLKNFTNRLDDTSAIRKTKRDLARVITLLTERTAAAPAPAAGTARNVTETATVVAAPSAPVEAVAVPAPAEKPAPKKKSSKKSEAKQS